MVHLGQRDQPVDHREGHFTGVRRFVERGAVMNLAISQVGRPALDEFHDVERCADHSGVGTAAMAIGMGDVRRTQRR